MSRERAVGIVLLIAGLLLGAGAALEIGSLMALPELVDTISAALQHHLDALLAAGYLLAGGGALIMGVCYLGS